MWQIRGMVTAAVLAAVAGVWAGPVVAQDAPAQVWIQIEARNSLAGAEARLRDWAGDLPAVTGFALASGWYAVALGPFTPEQAAERLAALRATGQIPRDSFIADGRVYRSQFWPAGAALAAPAPEPVAPVAVAPVAESATQSPPPQETLADARRAEAALSRDERQDIQRALQWAGVYSAAIDGAFGAGSRAAISAWQSAQGADPTGVLTSDQRAALIGGWQAELAAIGLERVRDDEAGVEIDLPLGLVAFDRYTPPFAQYQAKDDSGVQIWLISQPGDQEALYGLYDLLQSLAVVPAEGPRARRPRGFDI